MRTRGSPFAARRRKPYSRASGFDRKRRARAVGEIRLLIADDHSVVRQGLRMFLALDPDFQIVGEASTGEEAIQLARELHPQVVLMDLLMPGMGGVAATGTIRSEMPDVEVIALTSVLEDTAVTGAIRAGAIGYLLKNTEADELRQAVKSAAAGQVHLSPEAAARLVREVRIPGSPEVLTERETAVLRLIAKGQANKQVARELHIGEQTVKTHVSNILGKLQLQSRTQAALYAVERGLVSASDLGRG
jgi:NarL family two-component system response regulator LiaR